MIRLLSEAGAIIIGASDSHTGVFDPDGLDIEQMLSLKK